MTKKTEIKDIPRVLEGTVVAILEDEVLFVAQLNLPADMLKRTSEEWFASDQLSDVYRLSGIETDLAVGTEIRISFAITTMSIPPLAPVLKYEILEKVADSPRVLEGTVVAILEDEVLFLAQLNLPAEMLKRTSEEWFSSEQISDVYRLSGIETDVAVGTEIRISFAITTMSIPPLAPVLKYEILDKVA